MITGFNTDIEHNGVVYHVQTEDKGLDSPLILSLVYAGGAILASKRSPYEDLIASGFNEETLAQRLQRQHRLICAAINAGRIDELKRMGARVEDDQASASPAIPAQEISEAASEEPTVQPQETSAPPQDTVAPATPLPSAYTVHDPRRHSPLGEFAASETGLVLTILDEEEFRAGETFTIRILVQDRSGKNEKPIAGAYVSVKILGTTFRPQMYSVSSQRDGVAEVSTQIPRFTSGRAAILIQVVADSRSTEMRRVIYPAK